MRKTLLPGLLSVLVAIAAPAAAQSSKVTKDPVAGVTNFARVETTIACAGAVKAESIAAIGKMGFVSVINLRLPTEAGADLDAEAAAAKAAGMRYTHIPFDGAMPDTAKVDLFLAAITTPGAEPAFIHCASGNRASMMWLVKRVMVDHWNVDRATQEATDLGLTNPALKQFAVDYINTHRQSR